MDKVVGDLVVVYRCLHSLGGSVSCLHVKLALPRKATALLIDSFDNDWKLWKLELSRGSLELFWAMARTG